MRLELKRLYWLLKRKYYGFMYGVKFGIGGTMLPKFGKGTFVSVYKNGDYIEIINEKDKGMIRLIPYQPNHGVMVEYSKDGVIQWRTHCDYNKFLEMKIGEKT